jgi:hypothetical protein
MPGKLTGSLSDFIGQLDFRCNSTFSDAPVDSPP